MTPIVSSTFDIAHWFLQRGELNRTYVSLLKLQRLLYLAQSHYAGQHDGAPRAGFRQNRLQANSKRLARSPALSPLPVMRV